MWVAGALSGVLRAVRQFTGPGIENGGPGAEKSAWEQRWDQRWEQAGQEDELQVDLTFETSECKVGPATVVSVNGEIDVATAPMLRERLQSCIERGDKGLVVDLLGVPFLDSTALGVLVGAAKRLRENGGSLRIVLTEPRVAKVFEITGLTETLPISPTVDEAIGK
jgi:anti-sigma B factor antagonist